MGVKPSKGDTLLLPRLVQLASPSGSSASSSSSSSSTTSGARRSTWSLRRRLIGDNGKNLAPFTLGDGTILTFENVCSEFERRLTLEDWVVKSADTQKTADLLSRNFGGLIADEKGREDVLSLSSDALCTLAQMSSLACRGCDVALEIDSLLISLLILKI
jgi:hypothetical protein